jgi:hypothetical protein
MRWLFSDLALKAHFLGLGGIALFSVLLIVGDGVTPPAHFRIALVAWCAGYPLVLLLVWRVHRRRPYWPQEHGPLHPRTDSLDDSAQASLRAFHPGERVQTLWGQRGTVLSVRPHPMDNLGLVMLRMDGCGELGVPVLGSTLERLPGSESRCSGPST